MKKIFLVILLFVSLNAFSQLKYGVKLGANFANVNQNFANSDDEFGTKIRLAYSFGAIIEYEFSEVISLQSGLQLSSKGYSWDLEDGLIDGESVDGFDRYLITYLEVPINVVYKISDFRIIVGPYIAFGISGKNKYDYTYTFNGSDGIVKGDDDIKFKGKLNETDWNNSNNSNNEYVKGLDYGLSFGIGYSVGPMMINAGYDMGLANLVPDIEIAGFDFNAKDFKTTNRVMNLSVSYFFGK